MANGTYATPNLLTEPGFLYYAPLGSTLPTNTVVGGVFTDTWPVAWIALGLTDTGSKFTSSLTVEPIEAAEVYDPLAYRTTGRSSNVQFMLKNFCAANLVRALNGAPTTVTGSAGTTLTQIDPTSPGGEVRSMIGYESLDSTVRWVGFQCINSGDVEMDFAKAPANTNIPFMLNMEKPASTQPYRWWTAGTGRA